MSPQVGTRRAEANPTFHCSSESSFRLSTPDCSSFTALYGSAWLEPGGVKRSLQLGYLAASGKLFFYRGEWLRQEWSPLGTPSLSGVWEGQ